MLNSDNNSQSGQSFTLDVAADAATGETVVSCPSYPEIEPVRDRDQRFAIQQMRRKLDDMTHRGFQGARPLTLPRADDDFDGR